MLDQKNIAGIQEKMQDRGPEDILKWSLDQFGVDNIALASSLGVEDQVLTHMLLSAYPKAQIFTLDTGRLHQETYDVMDETMKRYNMHYDVQFPEAEAVVKMVSIDGPNLFYTSLDNRKKCCRIRKIQPLKRKLAGLQAWICGLRKDQSVTRDGVEKIEWDAGNNLVKINPLAEWSDTQVWDYIKKNNIPYNKLHDKGFASIGCAPCTRPIKAGENIRAGRWWWEQPEHKECGLHGR